MPVESPLPKNHPLMIAWKEYQKSESFENVQRWIFIPEHTHGSQWALFRDGYNASELQIQSLTTLCAELVEAANAYLWSQKVLGLARIKRDCDFEDKNIPSTHDAFKNVQSKKIVLEKALNHATELLKKKE